MLLDGGPTTVGIESTVVDLTGAHPTLLRPGMISAGALSAVLGVPVKRLGAPRIPVGYSKPLEDEARITPEKIAAAL